MNQPVSGMVACVILIMDAFVLGGICGWLLRGAIGGGQ